MAKQKSLIIAPSKFASNIEQLRKLDQRLRDTLIESMAFIGFHAKHHGNNTPASQWAESGLPLWQRQLGERMTARKDAKLSREDAQLWALQRAAEVVAAAFDQQAEARAKAKAKREAAKAEKAEQAPKVHRNTGGKGAGKADAGTPAKLPTAERYTLGHFNRVDADGQPAGKDEIFDLTPEEYAAAVEAVKALREASRKPSKVA